MNKIDLYALVLAVHEYHLIYGMYLVMACGGIWYGYGNNFV